jgi:hypothetical protein
MSTIGTRMRATRIAGLFRSRRVVEPNRAAEPSPAITPYWLLWSIGIVTFVLWIVAFVLWGVNGVNTLFDMIVAFCA